MARFDFISAAVQAYEFLWSQKSYLLRMIIPVLFVKTACLFAIFLFVQDGNPLYEGLFLLPAYVLEGVFAVCLVRFIAYKEPIFSIGHPVAVPEDFSPIENSFRGVYGYMKAFKAAVIFFVLLCLLDHVVQYAAYAAPPSSETDIQDPRFIMGQVVGMVIWISVCLYLFRFFFMYIGLALGCRIRDYAVLTSGMVNALRMVACVMLCIVPLYLFFAACFGLVLEAFVQDSAPYIIVKNVFMSFLSVMIVVNFTVAMTYGLEKMLSDGVTKRS